MAAPTVPLKANVPPDLRRRAPVRFAELEISFSHWLRENLERWLASQAASNPDADPDVVNSK